MVGVKNSIFYKKCFGTILTIVRSFNLLQYRSECESKLKEYSSVLSGLKVDQNELVAQLEDEKRKNEDLQFRFEEASITKSDVEVLIIYFISCKCALKL